MVISLIFAGYLVFLSISSVLFVLEFGIDKCTFPTTKPRSWVLGLSQVLSTRAALKNWVFHSSKSSERLHRLRRSMGSGRIFAVSTKRYPYTSGMVIYTFGANWIQGLYFQKVWRFSRYQGHHSIAFDKLKTIVTSFVVWGTSAL